jgi:catechol 2,3-dioxygenase-like lactoylglutathione lyase family enzyme
VEQRISLITLGVEDLDRARRFYTALGWNGQEVEETVFFQAGGMAFVLWGREKLRADSGIPDGPVGTFDGIVLAHNVRSDIEVDEVVRAAERAGAVVTRAPEKTFYGGYAGYFTDPDGHAWEIAHNPGFALAEDGSLAIPDFSAVSSPGGSGAQA